MKGAVVTLKDRKGRVLQTFLLMEMGNLKPRLIKIQKDRGQLYRI